MKNKRLDQMRNNPKNDWTIQDIIIVCRIEGVSCDPPTGGGSHYTVKYPGIPEILTIPSRRPIKTIYIKQLVALVDAIRNLP